MHRVGADIAAAAHKLDLDDDKIVDVLEIVPNRALRHSGVAPADDDVPRGSAGDLAGDVPCQGELTVVPPGLDLESM